MHWVPLAVETSDHSFREPGLGMDPQADASGGSITESRIVSNEPEVEWDQVAFLAVVAMDSHIVEMLTVPVESADATHRGALRSGDLDSSLHDPGRRLNHDFRGNVDSTATNLHIRAGSVHDDTSDTGAL